MAASTSSQPGPSSTKPLYKEFLGFHEKRVDEILAYWKTHPEFERQVSGVACLQALKDRKKPFILCEKKFDCRDHPFKMMPYPADQPVADWADMVHDLSSIPPNSKGEDVDAIISSTSGIVREVVSGREMVNEMASYMQNRTEETFKHICLPFSAPIRRESCSTTGCGLGKIDTACLIPAYLTANGVIFIADPVGWSTTVSVPPSYTPAHHDHWFSGQVVAHQFGNKLWFIFIANKENLDTYFPDMITRSLHDTERFIRDSAEIIVVMLGEPSIMVVPPHTIHAVLTFSESCHIATRVASSVWHDVMKTVSAKWNSEETRELVKGFEDKDDLKRVIQEYSVDLELWMMHFRSIQRQPTKLEEKMMSWALECKTSVMEWIKEYKRSVEERERTELEQQREENPMQMQTRGMKRRRE